MKKDGYYTVEAALVIPFVMIILAAMLYLIFYIHDREVIDIYLRRMAQESCYEMVKNETDQEIIDTIQAKYANELQGQMLMLHIDQIHGTCKKNILTHVCTTTWNAAATPQLFVNVEQFIDFGNVICQISYERVHARQWMYAYDILNQGGE